MVTIFPDDVILEPDAGSILSLTYCKKIIIIKNRDCEKKMKTYNKKSAIIFFNPFLPGNL